MFKRKKIQKNTTPPLPVECSKDKAIPKKKCFYCEVEKSLSEFSEDRGRHKIYCRKCNRKILKTTYKLRKSAPKQPKHCECCLTPKKECQNGRLVLDHDHETEEFRGWLCIRCNIGLGKFGDNVDGILMALNYLRMSEARKMINTETEVDGKKIIKIKTKVDNKLFKKIKDQLNLDKKSDENSDGLY